MKKMRQMLKNQKGLTLVELLAVVVIIGIIAAIAVPSIGKIIDNSKKDAHVANAEMLVSAARMAVAANDTKLWGNTLVNGKTGDDIVGKIWQDELVVNGYLESKVEDPDSPDGKYDDTYVMYNAKDQTYTVTLKGSKRGIYEVKANELGREDVESKK